ncbi:flagellin, partial [Pontiellaceae bacterium B1224]|nr:flagellin [Pontiellaceae bacterium B1224]
MQVSNNVSAFNVWKNYTGNVSNLRDSMSKLSSGSRINDAGDDPSGLAMSERLRTQSRNTAAAAGNVENKLNYLQTADSWMQKMHDMLGRMGELAVMANDGTKSQTDRDILQKEFGQMQQEIERITGVTQKAGDGSGGDANAAGKFNGIELFQGGIAISQQVGADGGQVFASASALDLSGQSTETVGSTTWGALITSDATDDPNTVAVDDAVTATVRIDTLADAESAVTEVNAAIDFISGKRADVGAEMKRMDQTLDGLRSYEENISATESRIRDVDVAKETAEMSKYNILQQVGTAMLA